MKDFSTLGLSQQLQDSLQRMNFSKPTPIQAQAIPVALTGRDILGSAQTGTGKTAAFGIPLLERLLTTDRTTALVMTPTRELATQVLKALQEILGPGSGIRSALLIGGESMYRQLNQLKGRPRLVVGTPGRINDHLERRSLQLRDAGFLVLDETDRMLDMGFGVQIDRILKHMPKERQTLLFSATLPPYIVELSKKYLHMPERIAVGNTHSPIEKIQQELIRLKTADKYMELTKQLDQREGSVIIFVKTKHGADRMALKLERDGHSAEAIHGDLKQSKRDRVIAAFRDKEHRILVATDVAARGLDIPHIEHVINYDLPQVPEDYIHRIGRTARAGKTGCAVCFITPEDGAKWKDIHHLMNPSEKSSKNDARADASLTDRKPAGKKPFGKKPGGKSSFGDGFKKDGFKKGGFKKPGFKSRDRDDTRGGDDRPSEDRPRRKYVGDKPFAGKPRERDDDRRPARDAGARKPFRSDDRKPAFRDDDRRPARRDDDRPAARRDDRPPSRRDDRPAGGRDERPAARRDERPAARRDDRPTARRDDRFDGEKTYAKKKTFGDKPFSKKPAGKKPFGDKPFSGDRPRGKPSGKPAGKPGGFKGGFKKDAKGGKRQAG